MALCIDIIFQCLYGTCSFFFLSFLLSVFLMMSTGLVSLPLELLIHLNEYLDSPRDRAALCLVARPLSAVFRDLVFHTVELHSPDQLIQVCGHLARRPSVFPSIRHLSINLEFAGACPYSGFVQYCSGLTRLTLGERFWVSAQPSPSESPWGEMTVDLDSYPQMPKLRCLEVDCKHAYGVDDLFPLLAKCPGLQEFRCRRILWLTMPTDMNHVHRLCPLLTTVGLDHKNAVSNLTDFLPAPYTADENDNGYTLKMRSFDFFHDGLWDDFVPWLGYMAEKYRGLTTLKLSMVPTWTNSLHHNDTVHVGHVLAAVRGFAALPHLMSVSFHHVWWAKDFFRCRINHIGPQAPLTQVTLLLLDTNETSLTGQERWDKTFHLFAVSDAAHVRSLTVSLQPRQLMKPLRLAHRLVRLTLVSSKPMEEAIDPRLFLSFCPSLRTLVIEGARLALDPIQHKGADPSSIVVSLPFRHLLEHLALTRCVFSNAVPAAMARLCLALRTLALTDSLLQPESPLSTSVSSLHLCFPSHALRSIRLHQVCLYIPLFRNPIVFVTIRQQLASTSSDEDTGGFLTKRPGEQQRTTYSFQLSRIRDYRVRRHEDNGEDRFMQDSRVSSVRRLQDYEIDYYRGTGVPFPTTEDELLRKRQKRSPANQNQQERLPRIMSGHLLVDVAAVTELLIDGKWIVLR